MKPKPAAARPRTVLLKKYADQVDDFLRACHALARNLYVTGYGGNCAWRLEKDLILITPTMMNKGDVTAKDLVFIDMDGKTVEGVRRPTGERSMYLKFFAERPDIVSVLHCHAPTLCAFAVLDGPQWLMRPFYPETTTEVGPVPLVPYAEPLTDDLAEAFSPFLQKYNTFLMANHGVVSMSRDGIRWTSMMVELLESTAVSLMTALGSRQGLKELPKADVVRLGNVMRARGLPLFGAPGVWNALEDLYFPR